MAFRPFGIFSRCMNHVVGENRARVPGFARETSAPSASAASGRAGWPARWRNTAGAFRITDMLRHDRVVGDGPAARSRRLTRIRHAAVHTGVAKTDTRVTAASSMFARVLVGLAVERARELVHHPQRRIDQMSLIGLDRGAGRIAERSGSGRSVNGIAVPTDGAGDATP